MIAFSSSVETLNSVDAVESEGAFVVSDALGCTATHAHTHSTAWLPTWIVLGCLGAQLGWLVALLGLSWAILVLSWALLGFPWGSLRPSLFVLAVLRLSWGSLGDLLGRLEVLVVPLGTLLGLS